LAEGIEQATITTMTDKTYRRNTIAVQVGSVVLGPGHPVAIQSMTKVPTTDVERCLQQIRQLAKAGCKLVRVAVPRRADTQAFAKLVERAGVPLIADVHFSAERAIEAIEAGAAKIRLNPGNITNRDDVNRIIDAAKMHGVAIRIGVNEASIASRRGADVPAERRVAAMMEEAGRYVRWFEKRRFERIVLSAKSSDVRRTIEINRRLAEQFPYPIHLGLTHAGLLEEAIVPSAVAIGTLLVDGIGDTIRVSAAGPPVQEVKVAQELLVTLGLAQRTGVQLVVCPSCARAESDVVALARQVRRAVAKINKPVRIAVMGCVVNGPGEAADADLAICAGKNKMFLYRAGKRIGILPPEQVVGELLRQLEQF